MCLKSLLWIDGFTLLVSIPGAKSGCDLIYVVHAGQWPVSRPEAALCHLFPVWFQDFSGWGASEICEQRVVDPLSSLGVKPWGLKQAGWNEQPDHGLSFRMADHLQHRGETPKTCWNRQTQCLLGLFGPWSHLLISLGLACLGCVKLMAYSLPASYIQQI